MRRSGRRTIRPKSILIIAVAALVLGGAGYYFWQRKAAAPQQLQVEYVVSPSLDVLNSRAQVHRVIKILKAGDRVEVLKTSGEWSQIHLEPATEGWVLARELISSSIYQKGQALLKQLSSQPVQAVAHAAGPVNIHTEPSRHAPVLGKLMQGEKLEVFNRKLVPRESAKAAPGRAPASPPRLDAWYLVRSGSRAGWLLGRLASLDIPPAIAQYAANYNLVAWFVLNTVTDEGQPVPQYLVADRVNSEKFDFTHIRVFTWSLTQHHYVTAYVESNLKGMFPIQVEHLHGVPYFRLRLVGRNGSKFQKIYRLSETIVRPAGTVEGWESSAMPSSSHRRARR